MRKKMGAVVSPRDRLLSKKKKPFKPAGLGVQTAFENDQEDVAC